MNIFSLTINWNPPKQISFANTHELVDGKCYKIVCINREKSKDWINKDWDIGAKVWYDKRTEYGRQGVPKLVMEYISNTPENWIYPDSMKENNIILEEI